MTRNRAFCQLDTDCIDWIADGCLERMWKNRTRLDYEKIAATFPVGKLTAGVYCVWERGHGRVRPLYVGESNNLRERIRQLRFLSQHTFARQYANLRARTPKPLRHPTKEVVGRMSRKKRTGIEERLEKRYEKQLMVGWVATSFGRKEVEESLIAHFQPPFNNP
ncbi:MAG TPA: hypothetical protein VM118_06550 [Acidobacteriota bacterium]|nr:hypothetical protein [Acidobacteriota bacterium]